MKRILAILALAVTAHAADFALFDKDGQYLRTMSDPAGRLVRETKTRYSRDVTAERLAKDNLLPVVVTNPYDPATHRKVSETIVRVGDEGRKTYVLQTVAEYETDRQAAKAKALKQAENAYIAAAKDPRDLAECIVLTKALQAMMKAGGDLNDVPRNPHIISVVIGP